MMTTRYQASKVVGKSLMHSPLQKCLERGRFPEDQISQLPNDILILILSFLPLKEAAQTSVLSSRWMTLWTQTLRLDFDAPDTLQRISNNWKILKWERRKYINWVNQVLHSHKGQTLEEFRVCFDMVKSFQIKIDKWLKYAFAKRVKRSIHQSGMWDAPYWICELKSLRELHLKSVDVTSEAIEFLLLRCPFLEQLVVCGSGKLVNLVISGQHLMLKYLEIKYCLNVQSITIRNSNLVSLKISHVDKLMVTENPMLSGVQIYGNFPNFPLYVFSQLSCCLSQLELLVLYAYVAENVAKLKGVPELSKLKELVICVGAEDDGSLVECTSFLKSCPNLQKFVVQLHWLEPSETYRKLEKAMKCSLKYLKVVELARYHARTSEFELIMFFLENAVALEKVIVDTRIQSFSIDNDFDEQAARVCATQQLEGLVPGYIQLVIL